jgi:hypothetical protein
MRSSSMKQLAECRASGALWRHARAMMRRLILAVNDCYRPERHYMRGPGPKCQAKRGSISSRDEDLD